MKPSVTEKEAAAIDPNRREHSNISPQGTVKSEEADAHFTPEGDGEPHPGILPSVTEK